MKNAQEDLWNEQNYFFIKPKIQKSKTKIAIE